MRYIQEQIQKELLEKLEETKKSIEELIELVEKYGIDDSDVNINLYLFARGRLLKLLEYILDSIKLCVWRQSE